WWNLFLALIVVLCVEPALRVEGLPVYLVLLVCLVLIGAAPFLFEAVLSRLTGRLRSLDYVHRKLVQVVRSVRDNQSNVALLIEFAVYASLHFALSLAVIYYCFACVGVAPSLAYLALCSAALNLNRLILITPGNIGVMEFIYAWLSREAGFGATEGVLAALILRGLAGINLLALGIMLGGLPYLAKYGRRKRAASGAEQG
ncbi:MAG TPA: hypothetical protein HPP83_10680, partial [Candidatus Hydrogenedentes bacterium]|nr:hypothetical protein [Candidatus Hydrogenedentota bacterium]